MMKILVKMKKRQSKILLMMTWILVIMKENKKIQKNPHKIQTNKV